MNENKIINWANLLLDVGKRNPLINFHGSKSSTLEVVIPDCATFLDKIEGGTTFELFDVKKEDGLLCDDFGNLLINKEEYVSFYQDKIRRATHFLGYNKTVNPQNALKNIMKKGRSAIEETGVNVSYIAFGFVHFRDIKDPKEEMMAPILLIPAKITRKSIVDPFFIKELEDEVIVNPTLSYKFLSDYKVELPEYEANTGVSYFDLINDVITNLGFYITKEVFIGSFSFQKINMYNDILSNIDYIKENNNVKILMDDEAFDSPLSDFNYDSDTELSNLHSVVDADNSQIDAIELSKSGASFVLQGPPGTGKSQTITNIIAEALYDNKKVLFVSEKLAALNVVYDKLKQSGLSDFCLELHSHKANKKDLIDELARTLRLEATKVSSRADEVVSDKINNIEKLASYDELLHEKRSILNLSLYELIDNVHKYQNNYDNSYLIENITSKDLIYLNKIVEELTLYKELSRDIGYNYHESVWLDLSDKYDYSYESKVKLSSNLKTLQDNLSIALSRGRKIFDNYSIEISNYHDLNSFYQLANIIASSKFITPKWFNKENFDFLRNNILVIKNASRVYKNAKEYISEHFDLGIYELNYMDLYHCVGESFFLFRPFNKKFKRGVELIKRYYKDTNVYKFNNKKAIYCARSLYNEVYYKEVFDGLDDKFKALLREYQGMDTDFETLEKEIESLYRIYDKTNFGIFDIMTDEMFNNALNDLKDNIEIIKNVLEEIKNTTLELEPLFIPKNFSLELSFSDILNNVNTYIDNIDIIDSFGRFVKLRKEMEKSEALSFLEWGIKNLIPTEDFASVFSNIFYTEWIYKYLEEISLFSELNRDSHDSLVNKFKEEDLNHFKINELKIKEKLSSNKPTLDVVTPGSSVAILIHESGKKKRQKPIRKLLGDIRELALKLKPCFLMSPLSVSSYLDQGFKFDLVIFDEASQVFPWDALGAIYRSTQMIVVGDTKQMPPTNFFTTTVGLDLDIDDEVSLFESILDIASTKYSTLRLKWHYRSRHESLIAFSNKNFYDNELVSFPSAKIKTKGIGVDYYYVDGVFDRARHNNIKEAEKVVDLIWKNIKTRPDKSMGVVAFSVAQQELIESGLIARRLADPSLEEYFSLDKKEPFFIKNLETVQGDERDIIIFSIGYGRDEEGKLLHNFGPINREGGERRLNVAVSRAKFNLEVVSSMHYYDIDLSKVSSKGARLLREYLQYAETGELLISKDEKEEYLDIDYIVNDIDNFIRSKGYKTKKSIGYSHQKIDICVNELQSDDFKIAIEVDGTTYHASQNVRDRERLRENVLEKNGFIFYRIWSVDWFKDKDKEKTKLLDFLNSNLRGMGTIDFDSTIEILDYSETAEVSHFSFPRYDYYNLDAIQSDTPFMDNYFDYMMTLIKKEAPVSEAWVIKRVKNYLTKKDFEDSKSILIDKGAIFKDGFIHFKEIKYPILRESIPSDLRKLEYIPLEELSLGLLELIKRNYRATIEGVYSSLLHCLGSRLTDKNRNYLNRALDLIKDKIIIEGEVVIYKE